MVAGVSLVTNYRDSFGQEVRTGGIDGLIKSLKGQEQAARRTTRPGQEMIRLEGFAPGRLRPADHRHRRRPQGRRRGPGGRGRPGRQPVGGRPGGPPPPLALLLSWTRAARGAGRTLSIVGAPQALLSLAALYDVDAILPLAR